MLHVSWDSETWGTRAGCDIRSIGACVMDVKTGHIWDGQNGNEAANPFYQATDNPGVPYDDAISEVNGVLCQDARYPHADGVDSFRQYPLTRDPATVQWWSEQSAAACAAFADPMDLREALIRFGGWLRGLSGDHYDPADHKRRFPDDRRLWSHGPSFDPPIIDAAYVACGLPVPWHYRAHRDTRTCFDLAGIDDHSAWLSARPGPLRIPHHALDDAICQARGICDAVAIMRYNTDRRADAFYAGWDARDRAAPSVNAVTIQADAAYNEWIQSH